MNIRLLDKSIFKNKNDKITNENNCISPQLIIIIIDLNNAKQNNTHVLFVSFKTMRDSKNKQIEMLI